MFSKCILLAATAATIAVVDAATVEADLLRKVIQYEADKATAAAEFAQIEQLIASMHAASPAVEPIQASALSVQASALSVQASTGSGSGKGGKSVGSSAGGEDYTIETLPVPTSKVPATEAPAKSGSTTGAEAVKATTPAPSKSAAVSIEMVAPVAVAVAAAAFTLF